MKRTPREPGTPEGELERLHPASFSWALVCCGRNREEAEDVLQTAYLRVLDGRARFQGRSSFKTFFFGVIRRTAAEQRRRRLLLRWTGLSRVAATTLAPEPSPEESAAGAEDASRLRGALAKLARRQRTVLELVFGHELTVEEAAGVLGISVGSARSHYHRGKTRLARALSRGEA